MTESMSNDISAGQKNISYEMLFCVVSWSLLQAATAAVTFSPSVHLGEANDAVNIGIDRGLLFLSIVLTYLSDFSICPRRENIVIGQVLSAILFMQLPLLAIADTQSAFEIPYPLARASWVLCGVGIGVGNIAWMESHLALDIDEFNHTSHWSIIAFTTILAAILLIPEPYILIAILVMFIAGTLLSGRLPGNIQQPEITEGKAIFDAKKQKPIVWNGSFVLLVNGIAEGMIAGLIVYRAASGTIHPVSIGVCTMLSAVIYVTFRKLSPGLLSPERNQLLFHPILIVAIVCVGFVMRPYNVIPAMIAFAILYLIDRVNYLALVLRGFLLEDSPTFFFERRRIWILIGLTIGWFIGAFVASEAGHGTFPYFSLGIIALICSHFSIIAVKPEWSPFTRGFIRGNEAERDSEKWSDLDSTGTAAASTPQSDNSQYITSRFKYKCAAVATEASLTPRESEVLCYLAKGRNAKYIASQLFISERTVKTHGYHIYQKLGIHSQQELIDLVENAETSSNSAEKRVL